MDFESPDVERDFPGLYASESGRRSDDSEFSDDSQKVSKKDLLIGKRKDKKDSKKDRGYATLEGESSPEEDAELKSPSKSKKSKAFKFSSKKEKREKSREKEVKDKDNDKVKDKKKSEDKDKEKKKDKIKLKLKDKKKTKQDDTCEIEELPVFGVALSVATERSKCHDGVELPLVVRDCIDHVQQSGITAENVYKVSGIKSRVQQVKRMYNQREAVSLVDYDLPVATSLLKEFLRELPEPVFTTELLKSFEEAGGSRCVSSDVSVNLLKALVKKLPSSNRTLLAWLVKHFDHIASHEKQNKMNVESIAATLSPVLQSSERLITSLVLNASDLFPDITLNKYIAPVRSADCLSVPDCVEAIERELRKQESLLEMLHSEMNRGFVSKKREEQLWEVQRIITQLKRRLRTLEKVSGPVEKQGCEKSDALVKLDSEQVNVRLDSASSIQRTGPVLARSPLLSSHCPPLPDGNDASVSKVEAAPPDVSPGLNKHVSSCLNLSGALNEHVPLNDEHVIKRDVGNVVHGECPSVGLRRQLSLRLEPFPSHPDSALNRTPSFRNNPRSYRIRQSDAQPSLINISLNRHPLFNDGWDLSSVRRASVRNSTSQPVNTGQQASCTNSTAEQPQCHSLVKGRSRIRPPASQVKEDVGGRSERLLEGGGDESTGATALPLSSAHNHLSQPTSLPTNINHFKPSESLEVEEINKSSILVLEKKQLAVLETEELTNVIINLRALCQLESKEINRISNKIVQLGGNPNTYLSYLSDDCEDEVTSLPLPFERNGMLEKKKQLKWESHRLKKERDVLLKSICTECEACISLRVQIKLLQINKNNNQC